MSKVPVILCGKFEVHITGISKLLLPDYDVIHNCRSLESATTELPRLLAGQPIQPSSGFGSNYNNASPVSGADVKAIIVGGGFSPSDFEQIRKTVDEVKLLPFFRPDTSRPGPGGIGPPPPDVLAERVRKAMDEVNGEWKAGVYLF